LRERDQHHHRERERIKTHCCVLCCFFAFARAAHQDGELSLFLSLSLVKSPTPTKSFLSLFSPLLCDVHSRSSTRDIRGNKEKKKTTLKINTRAISQRVIEWALTSEIKIFTTPLICLAHDFLPHDLLFLDSYGLFSMLRFKPRLHAT
jgi:hypothetical protein